jgi:hypothetical protein
VRRNTTVKTEATINVVIQGVECFGFVEDEQASHIDKVDVTFHMTTVESELQPVFTNNDTR